ncbi:hypothetical protein GDO86_004933 [Hymenochirus boettgeri]|uniref:Lymphoid-restricted membrane protein n=1 Tax=Hymenochirus boettgeri TaxID=247094 RepID=A0A8T2J2N5_9PIPI|nr:hypothetical protein GDO86_004933 [Hymenochirus boettgeri]
MNETGSATKRHNPVDSICRKIKTIQMRDQESNPNLQIPKFQSRNFDSPQSNTKKNLEEMLKNRTVKNPEKVPGTAGKELGGFSSPSINIFSPGVRTASPHMQSISECGSPLGNSTYSINLMVKDKNRKIWPPCKSQSCSTPVVYAGDLQFKFSQSALPSAQYRRVQLEEQTIPSAPSPSFYFADRKSETIALQSPVVKRLSLSETGGFHRAIEQRTEPAAEVSLICEEDLLDSIFHACDTDHRGKVAVSKIVDYLRHTTSRGSEDSGLDELCNMLDPEKQDISMDLDTYHAIMKEWIDDCRNNCTDNKTKESALAGEESMFKLRESLLAVRRISGTMNITSGSLEAFGGDISRGDLETSDLITCVADLQYNNQKLQEQHGKLKTTIEALEEANHRLLEENEELHNQWKNAQQSVTRARGLKEELEEMKQNMSSAEERKAQVVAQNKQLEKENLGLIHKISSLQEENIRSALEAEGLRRTMSEITDKVAVLQIQLNESESAMQKRDATLHMKDLYIEELKSTLGEYASVMENLRAEKLKLENNLQQMEQELISNGINSPITHKFSRIISGGLNSLQSELELAQHSPEVSVADWMSPSGQTSSLDVTLDREVLLLLQGPGQDQAALEFKVIMQSLQEDTCGMADLVLVSLQHLIESDTDAKDLPVKMLELIKTDLKEKRNSWTQKLKQLEKHRESLDKEFVKLAGNLRRLKTERVHLRKELSTRFHELEMTRQRHEDAEGKAETAIARLTELTLREEDFTKETEFLRLSLGFKCDLFTLDKRLRMEERSRDLAEENLKKEIDGCIKLLKELFSLCEEDNGCHDIVKKLEKSLQFLNLQAQRVASRSEMLGSIHQESRVSKAVDVMIQHVENLKRMYAKEHTELEELREVIQQNDRSGSTAERVLCCKSSILILQPSSLRRVSMPAYTRNIGTINLPLESLGGDKLDGKFHKRSNSWKLVGSKPSDRPALQRFVTTYPRPETSDEKFIKEDESGAELSEDLKEETFARKLYVERSFTTHKPSLYSRVNSWASDLRNSITSNKTIVISCVSIFLIAALASFLTGLSFHRPVDGAPVGTGNSWTALQQFLWPYTGLRHNGQPPV